ncbi:MAG TPA: efflux RND transporter periplasmic adaptor subunit [Thermoanaerobaculia bacterium]|jgi:RND family efflux transporter MFP subunit|nr:efflux RND transporter periplasmic adaptor subunit [Thermoanaerobaculia bacterium]HPA51634.1 efflux RND transporter periplasmic adaptor subunit [Thermoanaerobaculia bacterium]HQN06621.1 efflux RND transporter periplasmic adaptor subunit [Thermoanaerobaculia bacterium]HQP85358.1 efflux RND transporter periplasmic adaptor subunit [Thermoanaerobaculia bacterium]
MSLTEPSNRTADLSALKIRRDERPDRGRWVLPAAATVIVVAVGAFFLLGGRGVTLRSPEVSVTRVALVTPTQASTVLTASGYIVARSKAEISPKSVGRVAWLNLEEGQRVRKGELVARLESQELEAQRKQYAAAREQALAELVNARTERQRAAQLLKEAVGSQQAFDGADARVNALEAQVASIEAQVRYVEELIRNAEIYAPIDGVVTVKKAFVGETVSPQGFGGSGSAGATFAVIVDLGSLEMEADINEQNLGRLSIGQPAEVALDAYPDRPYKARLRQIVPTADRQKGSVKVKIEILDRDARILPEMSCRVVFLNPEAKVDAEAKPKVMVPTASVVEVGAKKGVLLVRDGQALFRPLELGAAAGSQLEVVSGVDGGEEIVAEAAASDVKWRAEQKVRVKKD